MSLFARTPSAPVHLAAKAREVFDVSGAGDTVAAAVALGLPAGWRLETAMQIANVAAGIVVGKRGTATATPGGTAGRNRRRDRGTWRRAGRAVAGGREKTARGMGRGRACHVGFTNGCFDILHAGHISLLRAGGWRLRPADRGAEHRRVGERLKGPERPVQSEDVRAAVMAAVKGVDAVILFGEQTPLEVIRNAVAGRADQGCGLRRGPDRRGGHCARARGGRIVRVTLVDGQSTTKVIEKSRKPAKS